MYWTSNLLFGGQIKFCANGMPWSESIIHPTSSELTNEGQVAVTLNDTESQELK